MFWPPSISGLSVAARGLRLGIACHVPEIPVACRLILVICDTACTKHILNLADMRAEATQ